MVQKVSFYVVQRLEGRSVVEVLPEAKGFDEAKAYVRSAAKMGVRFGMTRCSIRVDCLGRPLRKSLTQTLIAS